MPSQIKTGPTVRPTPIRIRNEEAPTHGSPGAYRTGTSIRQVARRAGAGPSMVAAISSPSPPGPLSGRGDRRRSTRACVLALICRMLAVASLLASIAVRALSAFLSATEIAAFTSASKRSSRLISRSTRSGTAADAGASCAWPPVARRVRQRAGAQDADADRLAGVQQQPDVQRRAYRMAPVVPGGEARPVGARASGGTTRFWGAVASAHDGMPAVETHQVVRRQVLEDVLVRRGDADQQPFLCGDPPHVPRHDLRRRPVQRRQELIAGQDLDAVSHGASQPEAVALAVGQFAGQAAQQLRLRQATPRGDAHRPIPRPQLVDQRAIGGDRHRGEPHRIRLGGELPQAGGLAAAAHADEGHDLAWLDVQRERVDVDPLPLLGLETELAVYPAGADAGGAWRQGLANVQLHLHASISWMRGEASAASRSRAPATISTGPPSRPVTSVSVRMFRFALTLFSGRRR